MPVIGNNIKQLYFQKYLKTLPQTQQQHYLMYREGLKKRTPERVPEPFQYLYICDLINCNIILDTEAAIEELIYMYRNMIEPGTRLARLLPRWIGDMYLTYQEKETACRWYHESRNETLINFLLSYYNHEKGLEKMPLQYWSHLYQKRDFHGIPEKTVMEQFSRILIFLNKRMKEDIQRTLLDYLNVRPTVRFFHQRFHRAIYGDQPMYLMTPYKKYLHYYRMTEVLEELLLYSIYLLRNNQEQEKTFSKERLPKRIRGYLAELNILRIVGEEKGPSKKKVFLDEEKIQKTLHDQVETVSELKTLMAEEEKEDETAHRRPIGSFQELFFQNRELKPALPPLTPQEREMIAFLIKGTIQEESLKALTGKTFIHQVVNDLNEKFYPFFGSPLIEKEGKRYFIHDEHRFDLKQMDLTSQEES